MDQDPSRSALRRFSPYFRTLLTITAYRSNVLCCYLQEDFESFYGKKKKKDKSFYTSSEEEEEESGEEIDSSEFYSDDEGESVYDSMYHEYH